MLALSFRISVESLTFALAALICVMGSVGVVALRNPVHNALSLVATLFGVAVLFVAQGAYFLAAIQVIVYAGAIVILFLFVIMLLGVDATEELGGESSYIRRPLAVAGVIAIVGLVLTAILSTDVKVTGARAANGQLGGPDIDTIGRSMFTDHVFAFEITSVLLTIAVVGAVVLVRRHRGEAIDLDEFPAELADVEATELDLAGTDDTPASSGASS